MELKLYPFFEPPYFLKLFIWIGTKYYLVKKKCLFY